MRAWLSCFKGTIIQVSYNGASDLIDSNKIWRLDSENITEPVYGSLQPVVGLVCPR